MEPALPTIQAIQEIESRQDEVLRKLDELEKRLAQTLAQFGDSHFVKCAENGLAATSDIVNQSISKAA
jgi:hypothetical protein